MKSTPEQVSKLPTHELTMAIAKLVYGKEFVREEERAFGKIDIIVQKVQIVDYYNNMNDLMPLVIEHGISLVFRDDGDCDAYVPNDYAMFVHISVINKDPQRALAECLLIVLQSKRNNQ